MKLQNITLVVLCTVMLQCCAQKQPKKQPSMTVQEANTVMEELYKTVQYTDKESQKLFSLEVFNGACNYKIWINDMPVYHMFKGARGELSFTINGKILKSGTQTLKIRIFPFWNREERKFEDYLHKYAGLDVSISEMEWDEESRRFQLYPVLTYQTPREGKESLQENPREFKFTEGKEQIPYYEETVSFEVEVPYSLKGWSESVDLSKEDPKALLKEVEAYYLELAKNFEEKDIPAIAVKYYNKEKEVAQALFFNEKKSKSRWDEVYLADILNPTTKVDTLEEYKLEFYGRGKVVNLVDDLLGFKPFVLIKEDKEGKKIYSSYDIYLHRPKPGAPLEMIR